MHNVSINIVRKKNIYIHLSQKIYSTIESHNANQFSSTELDPSLRASRNTRGFNLEKKKSPLDFSTLFKLKTQRREEKEGKKERKGRKEKQSKGAAVELPSAWREARVYRHARKFQEPSLASSRKRKLSSVGVQLLDRTRDTTAPLTRNSPLFISVADRRFSLFDKCETRRRRRSPTIL